MADGASHNNIPASSKACHADELAEHARVWSQTIYGAAESDEDVDRSESPMGMDDSDEEDDWRNIEDDCPPWQAGLTAGELVEEEFEVEAMSRGGLLRPYLITCMSDLGSRPSNV